MKFLLLKMLTILFWLNCLNSHLTAQQDSLAVYFRSEKVLHFANFLFNQQDYPRALGEYQRYLFFDTLKTQPRTYYQMGRCYLNIGQSELANRHFLKAAHLAFDPALSDSACVAYAGTLLLGKQDQPFKSWVDSVYSQLQLTESKQQLQALRAIYHLRHQEWTAAKQVLSTSNIQTPASTVLLNLAHQGEKLPRKSRWVAGLLSSIIPGAGKIYAQRPMDGIYSLLVVAGTSALAYEGFRDKGRSSFKGWFFGSLATFFYTGNIYGATVAVKFYNQIFEDRLHHEIEAQLAVRIPY